MAQPTPSLAVGGDVQKPRTWTPAQLCLLASAQTIETTLKGKPCTARGVPLWALIEGAAPRLDPKTKHSDARFVVLARGEDGYLASLRQTALGARRAVSTRGPKRQKTNALGL